MTTIYLVRHGQKQPQACDPGLTEIGVRQAKETGEYLKQFPITKIITSPYKRAAETAAQISKILAIPYTSHSSLVERMNWEDGGVSKTEFLQEWIKATNDREYVSTYGDSSRATGQRIEALINESATQNDHIVLVTHGGAILDYLRNIFGDDAVAGLRTVYDQGADYQMMNCAINRVEVSESPTIKLLNFVDHLSDISE